ncbi:unnamed protein product [Moneuplotes crassus]|uniref:Uncharacterized protein n=1 Tax=Euplotes crassus TaxID=5936 RepID=A0AAD1UIM2_EUPCR|nr:unnamed protein product [Moneuplotes crassus]
MSLKEKFSRLRVSKKFIKRQKLNNMAKVKSRSRSKNILKCRLRHQKYVKKSPMSRNITKNPSSDHLIRNNLKSYLKNKMKIEKKKLPIIKSQERQDSERTFSEEDEKAQDYISSYFNIEIKTKKDARKIIYSTVDDQNNEIQTPIEIERDLNLLENPVMKTADNVYKNIKCSESNKCITPSLSNPFRRKLIPVGYKGVAPSVMKRKTELPSNDNSFERDPRNYTTLLELNPNTVHSILENIRLKNRSSGVKSRRIHCPYKGKRTCFPSTASQSRSSRILSESSQNISFHKNDYYTNVTSRPQYSYLNPSNFSNFQGNQQNLQSQADNFSSFQFRRM